MRIRGNMLTGFKRNGIKVIVEVPEETISLLQNLIEEVDTPEEVLRDIALEYASDKEAILLKEYHDLWDPDYIDDEGKKMYTEGQRVRHSSEKGIELYEDFKHDKEYLEGDRFIFEDELWEVIADHTSTHFTPPEVNYWYVNVSEKLGFDSETGEIEEWPEWVQPTGYENTYKKGAKVTYEGKRYILEADSSSHSPTTPHSGWQLVEERSEEEI